jgi:hypothetical protein
MPSRAPSTEDPSIPVLTERLAVPLPAAAAAAPSGPAPDAASPEWLDQLAVRLPHAVDAAVAAHLEAAIEGATARLAEQLREALGAAVRDSVAAALAAERERLRRP